MYAYINIKLEIYFDTVREFNIQIVSLHKQITFIFNKEIDEMFVYEPKSRKTNHTDIHMMFKKTHDSLLDIVSYAHNKNKFDKNILDNRIKGVESLKYKVI